MDVSESLKRNVERFQTFFEGCGDVKETTFFLGKQFDVECYVAHVEVTSSNVSLGDSVIGKMLVTLEGMSREELLRCVEHNGLGIVDGVCLYTMEEAVSGLLTGDVVVFVDGIAAVYKIPVKGYPGMGVSENSSEPNVRGSKEGFTDSVKANSALIRKRLRTNRLKVKEIVMGVRSHTTVALVYMEDVVKEGLVEQIEGKLDEYEMDGIFDSGMLIQLMEPSPNSPFPQYQATERPDRAAMAILEGRVVLLADNSPMAVLLPANYNNFFVTTDDYFNRWEVATMGRMIRYFASLIAMFLPGLYLAVVQFHSQVVPATLMLTIASARKGVPFTPFVEIVVMELAFELLREAGIRIPGSLGKSMGIVGGLIVGQAAVDAGLVSPIVVIVVALTALASFCVPNEEFGSAFRLIKFALILGAAFLGMYGIFLGILLLTYHLCSLKSMGYPFLMGGEGRERSRQQGDALIRVPSDQLTRRSAYANEKEKIRLKRKGKQGEEGENAATEGRTAGKKKEGNEGRTAGKKKEKTDQRTEERKEERKMEREEGAHETES